MERVAPSQINYDDQLPIAISSKSSRREFFPEGGSTYGFSGGQHPNIVRIPINADSMLDCQNSYLKFDFVFPATDAGGFDLPQSYIKRLRILSGGTVLEDIDQYGRLYAGILYPAQAGYNSIVSGSITNHQCIVSATTQAFGVLHNVEAAQAVSTSHKMCIQLASGLLNMDKYLPLVMMNAGFTIELELDVQGSFGIGTAAAATPVWSITNIRYVAHLIDLERDFYDRLRMVMEGSGGVLQLAGQTFRHYSGNFPTAATNITINVPARVKSIKSIFFKNTIDADVAAKDKFGVSDGVSRTMTEYQFRVGSVVYPPQAVAVGVGAVAGEALLELEKAFGNLSDYRAGSGILNSGNYLTSHHTGSATGAVPFLGPLGLDFESFNRSAIENGVNSADRSLPITLEIKALADTLAGGSTVDVYVLCDAIFYVNLDGTCSVSI